MRIIFKIFAIPFVIILTPLVALLTFLFCYAVIVLYIISGIGVLLGVVGLITGQTTNGLILLGIAFLISPFGIPAIASWLVSKLDDLNYSLKNFITS
jgi:hypothetical protein